MKTKWLAMMVLGAFACGTATPEDSGNPTTGGKADTTRPNAIVACDYSGLAAPHCLETASTDTAALDTYAKACTEFGGKVLWDGCPKARLGGCQVKSTISVTLTQWFDQYSGVRDRAQLAEVCARGGGVFIASSWPKIGCDFSSTAAPHCLDTETLDAAVLSVYENQGCAQLGGTVIVGGCPRGKLGGCEVPGAVGPVKVIQTQWFDAYPGVSSPGQLAPSCESGNGTYIFP